MSINRRTLHRGVAALGAVAALVGTAAPAFADDPPPNCTAADLTGVLTGVSASMTAYLFTHPDVNNFYTSLRGKSRDEQRAAVQAFFDANPQAADEVRAIRAPSLEFRDRCDVELPD